MIWWKYIDWAQRQMGHNINVTVKIQAKDLFSLSFSFYFPRFFWYVVLLSVGMLILYTVKTNVEGFFPRFSFDVHKKYSGGRYINVVPDS